MNLESSRRAFLRALGLGAASLAACERIPVRHALPYLLPPEEITPGVPTFYASTCTACPAGCGLMVKVLAGRPVKLEGNREHPLSRGGLCASGQAWLRSLYDPRRLKAPTLDGKTVSFSELDAFVARGLERISTESSSLWIVTPTISSPTARGALSAFADRYGGRIVVHDVRPRVPSALLEAYELVLGEPLAPSLHLDEADLLVSFGADLFGAGAEPVAHTAAWTSRRRLALTRGPARHVQLEASSTLTGAAADERWPATSGERRELALALLRLVTEKTGAPFVEETLSALPDPPERLRALAEELLRKKGRSVVVSGDNDLGEQLAVALVNRLLGNEGRTVDVAAPSLTGGGLDRELLSFHRELLSGRIGGLFLVGIDLVGLLPRGQDVAEAIGRIPMSVAVSDRPNSTTAACHAVAAAHHGLECWADVEPRLGRASLAQPTVRPLFATRHPFESFLHWSGVAEVDWRTRLMSEWSGRGDWTEIVRSAGASASPGATAVVEDDSSLTRALEVLGAEASRSPQSSEVEVELAEESFFRSDGDSENPWLRELPDPITRVSWVPTVKISPALARERGIEDGDVVRVSTDDGTVVLPARLVPGQHPRVVTVPLGYRESEEENGATLVPLEAERIRFAGIAAVLERTGTRRNLPLVQVHSASEGRPVVHQVFDFNETVHGAHHPEATLWPERVPAEAGTPHWEMVIDLDACTGCSACVVACQAENNIPVVGEEEVFRQREMHWLRIDRYFEGDETSPDVLFEPMLCAQCDNAPCETVCPVAATVHSQDGLNQQVYNRCVGTRYCANNCPYKVRRFNWFDNQPSDPVERLVLNPDVVVRSRGVMEKCTFCVQRIQGERLAARREGRGARLPETACQQSCPAQAIRFGDGTDPESEVVRLLEEPRAFQVLADLGVRPSVTYLARVRNRERVGR